MSYLRYDIIVIGGGIVGLATAFKIKEANPKLRLLLIEKEKDIATHQTGHNSGVIHSGLYYKPGTLKATNCINGYNQLLTFCNEEEIPYELCGKIVVATSEAEVPRLHNLWQRGLDNGLKGLKKLSKEELREHEPHVNGLEGLYVPQTGIVNFKNVANRYADRIKFRGGHFVLAEKVKQITLKKGLAFVQTNKQEYEAKLVVNCAGLFSDKITGLTQKKLNVKIIPFRGEYYQLKENKKHLVKNLIYPVPDPNFPFLGVHFTRMINGNVEAGPNAVLAFKREGYKKSDFSMKETLETLAWPGFRKVFFKYWMTGFGEMYRSLSKSAFTKALQKLVPEIREKDLVPGGSGVRAQACDRKGGLLDDFLILEDKNIIHVGNAPSPAATSSLAIGETVARLAIKRLG